MSPSSRTLFTLGCVAVLLCVNIHTCLAVAGIDLSYFQGDVSQASWNCLKQSGKSFAVIQAQLGSGTINPYVANNIKRAKAAGIDYVDVYIFPDINRDPAEQVQATINFINQNGAGNLFGEIWLDIEGPQYWTSNCNTNIAFLSKMVNAARATGHKVQIYTSASQWNPIMCGSTAFSGMQLWYAHYDSNPSFGDFSPFGGWSHPAIKQYQGTTSMCGTEVDLDFY